MSTKHTTQEATTMTLDESILSLKRCILRYQTELLAHECVRDGVLVRTDLFDAEQQAWYSQAHIEARLKQSIERNAVLFQTAFDRGTHSTSDPESEV